MMAYQTACDCGGDLYVGSFRISKKFPLHEGLVFGTQDEVVECDKCEAKFTLEDLEIEDNS